MDSQDLNAIAHRWFDAFNKHDLEQLLVLYHHEAEHFSPKLKVRHPETNGLIRGKKLSEIGGTMPFKGCLLFSMKLYA